MSSARSEGQPKPTRGRGRPPRSERERAAQRARLIEAAMDAIRDGGPDTALVDMAARAGVTKPVLYGEFGDKQGVADAIAVELADQMEARVISTLTTSGSYDITGIVHAVVDSLITLIDEEPHLYSFLVRSIRQSDRGFLDNALVRTIHARAQLLIGFAFEGVAQKDLRVLTDGVFGFLFAAVESWRESRGSDKAHLVDTLSQAIHSALVGVVAGQAAPSER